MIKRKTGARVREVEVRIKRQAVSKCEPELGTGGIESVRMDVCTNTSIICVWYTTLHCITMNGGTEAQERGPSPAPPFDSAPYLGIRGVDGAHLEGGVEPQARQLRGRKPAVHGVKENVVGRQAVEVRVNAARSRGRVTHRIPHHPQTKRRLAQ